VEEEEGVKEVISNLDLEEEEGVKEVIYNLDLEEKVDKEKKEKI
jgi:hypothetical protein